MRVYGRILGGFVALVFLFACVGFLFHPGYPAYAGGWSYPYAPWYWGGGYGRYGTPYWRTTTYYTYYGGYNPRTGYLYPGYYYDPSLRVVVRQATSQPVYANPRVAATIRPASGLPAPTNLARPGTVTSNQIRTAVAANPSVVRTGSNPAAVSGQSRGTGGGTAATSKSGGASSSSSSSNTSSSTSSSGPSPSSSGSSNSGASSSSPPKPSGPAAPVSRPAAPSAPVSRPSAPISSGGGGRGR